MPANNHNMPNSSASGGSGTANVSGCLPTILDVSVNLNTNSQTQPSP